MGVANIDEFFCPNEACSDYGKKGKGNIVLKEHYGKQNTALLRCKTCKKTFSENRGTPFFGLHTPKETVLWSMAMLVEKGSIRGTARALGANKDSVALWLKRAGEHCEEVTEYLLRDLKLSQVQIDEIWTFVKKKDKNRKPDDPDEVGTKYVLIAQEAKTKLVTSYHVGGRALEDAVELLAEMESRRDKSTELPVFTTDDWDAYKNALVEVYGVEEQPEYKGRGRPPNSKKVPPPDLKYGQVVKYREGNEVTDVKKRVVFGNEKEVLSALKLAGNSINTSYIERNNLTVRNGVSRLIRKTIDFSKRLNPLVMHLCLFIAWFNLVKSHDALKIEIADGRRRWKQRTPAMAANLTDHVWTLEELFRFKPPP